MHDDAAAGRRHRRFDGASFGRRLSPQFASPRHPKAGSEPQAGARDLRLCRRVGARASLPASPLKGCLADSASRSSLPRAGRRPPPCRHVAALWPAPLLPLAPVACQDQWSARHHFCAARDIHFSHPSQQAHPVGHPACQHGPRPGPLAGRLAPQPVLPERRASRLQHCSRAAPLLCDVAPPAACGHGC